MRLSRWMRKATVIAVSVSMLGIPALAQDAQTKKPFEPSVGQAGKDVVWVPTPQALVDKMLDMAGVTAKDYVMDLGSGDGRTVITAAKRGATAVGIEYNPDMVELSKRNAAEAKVEGKATFLKADLFQTDLSKATVITMFLLPSINMKLRPKILNLKPGTRIVSNTFTMEDWEPDEQATIEGDCTSWCTALFWVVPAKVAGSWQLPDGRLTLKQQFQKVSGTLGSTQITDANLRGDQLSFNVGATKYTAKVTGATMAGSGGKGGASWTAAKAPAAGTTAGRGTTGTRGTAPAPAAPAPPPPAKTQPKTGAAAGK
jgi:Methyltransferase domain